MNVFKYSLMLSLALGVSTARPAATTPADPFQPGGNLQFATDLTTLQGFASTYTANVNQDPTVFFSYLNDFNSDYYNINSTYDSTLTSTEGDQFVTMMQNVWTAISAQISQLTGAIQTTITSTPATPPNAFLLNAVETFAGILNAIPGAQFLSASQLTSIQNINGPSFNAPTPVATTAAGTVNGVLNNYYFLCPSITTLVTGTTATTKTVTSGKTTKVIKKPAPAKPKTAAQAKKTVVKKK